MWTLWLFLVLIDGNNALNVLVYQPLMMESHVNFMARIADIVADAGHNVTVLASEVRKDVGHRCRKVQKVVTIEQGPNVVLTAADPGFGWFVKPTPESQTKAMEPIGLPQAQQCKYLLNHDQMKESKTEHFDVLLHEVFDMCGLAIFEALSVRKHIILSSTRHMDPVPAELGLLNPWYQAGILSDYGSTVSFFGIHRNIGFIRSFLKFTNSQPDVYKDELKRLGIQMPLNRVIRSASGVFLNTHFAVDSWRPSLREIIDVGGIAVDQANSLDERFSILLSTFETVVLVSFGTVVPSCHMPFAWRQQIQNVIKERPNILFLWKYEQMDNFTKQLTAELSNVFVDKFLPQNDLLASGRVNLFVTHSGQNSVLEAATAGVPLLLMPMFGDQFRNAMAVSERGMGIFSSKNVLSSSKQFGHQIDTALANENLRNRAQNISQLIKSSSITSSQLLLHKLEEWTASDITFDESPKSFDFIAIFEFTFQFCYGIFILFSFLVVAFILSRWRSKCKDKIE